MTPTPPAPPPASAPLADAASRPADTAPVVRRPCAVPGTACCGACRRASAPTPPAPERLPSA